MNYTVIFLCLPGEADIVASDGGMEIYNIKIDSKRQMIQLSLIRQLSSSKESRQRRSAQDNNDVQLNVTKIVLQDFKKVCFFFMLTCSYTHANLKVVKR